MIMESYGGMVLIEELGEEKRISVLDFKNLFTRQYNPEDSSEHHLSVTLPITNPPAWREPWPPRLEASD
jgi:hypothetical protein